MKSSEEQRRCPICENNKEEREFIWVYDRYGIPWKKVCLSCEDIAIEEISDFHFDPGDAGESLEGDDY